MSVLSFALMPGGCGQSFGAKALDDIAGVQQAVCPSALPHTDPRPGPARPFRLPVAAAQGGDHPLAAFQRAVDHRKAAEGTLPFADLAVLLEQAHDPVRA